jgi:hypothetical protein
MAAVLEAPVAKTREEIQRECLALELDRLRLLLRRRASWLRQSWQEDSLSAHRGLVISDARANQLMAGGLAAEESHFHATNSESLEITRALESLDRELAARRRAIVSDGMFSLETLQRIFMLGDFERDALLLCFAAEEDRDFATLCAYLQDDVTATRVTAQLLVQVLCAPGPAREAARLSLLPTATLRHFRLLELDEVSSTARIDERIRDFIRGVNRLDPVAMHLLKPVARSAVHSAHAAIVNRLTSWAESAADRPWPLICLTGSAGSGKRAVAAEFCARVGLVLHALSAREIPVAHAERHELLHLLQRESVLMRMAFYVDLDDIDGDERATLAAVRDALERCGGVVIMGGRERPKVEREVLQFDVPRLDAVAQRESWNAALQGIAHDANGGLDSLVQQFDLGPGEIALAANAAAIKAQARGPGTKVSTADLWSACRAQAAAHLGSLAERIVPVYGWDDIVLPDELDAQLRELAAQLSARSRVYEEWGFGARLPRGRGIAALFSGPSGTGKTMAAEILARHLEVDLYRIDLAGVVSKYIGETEKNLRGIFDAAERSGAMLFFDEADALFGKRTEVRDSHDRYANIEVNYLLQRMEDYRGIAILCTNRRSSLDRAFLRRLRFLLEFPFPDAQDRRRLWQKIFPPAAPLGALDFDALARLEVPGGNIRTIALNAAFLAASHGQVIETAHVLHAARREYSKIDKLITAAEFGANYRQGAR